MTEGQFQIIVLEGDPDVNTHSFPGPWGLDLTSSTPYSSASIIDNSSIEIKILPRANERDVDPASLKVRPS